VKEEQLVCRRCALPIYPGDPRWSAREPLEFWHYACAEEANLTRSSPFAMPQKPKETPWSPTRSPAVRP